MAFPGDVISASTNANANLQCTCFDKTTNKTANKKTITTTSVNRQCTSRSEATRIFNSIPGVNTSESRSAPEAESRPQHSVFLSRELNSDLVHDFLTCCVPGCVHCARDAAEICSPTFLHSQDAGIGINDWREDTNIIDARGHPPAIHDRPAFSTVRPTQGLDVREPSRQTPERSLAEPTTSRPLPGQGHQVTRSLT